MLTCIPGLRAHFFFGKNVTKKCQDPPAQPRRLSSYDDLGSDYAYGCLGRYLAYASALHPDSS